MQLRGVIAVGEAVLFQRTEYHPFIGISMSSLYRQVLVQVRRRHREQVMQLLRVVRKVDLLESRFASALGHWPPQRSATSELERQLSALEAEMGPSASGEPSDLNCRSYDPCGIYMQKGLLAAL